MAAACLSYLLAATDVHAKNFSLLHARGTPRPSLRLAPFYDIASAWPYTRRMPVQKIRLALRIGGNGRRCAAGAGSSVQASAVCRATRSRCRRRAPGADSVGAYRVREILPRHFRKLALAGSYPADALLATLAEFSRRVPDEAAALLKETSEKGMSRPVLAKL